MQGFSAATHFLGCTQRHVMRCREQMPWIETTAIAVALREVPGASSMEWTDKQLKKLENAAKKAGVDVRLPRFVIDPLGLLVPSPSSPHTHINPICPHPAYTPAHHPTRHSTFSPPHCPMTAVTAVHVCRLLPPHPHRHHPAPPITKTTGRQPEW